MCSEKTQEFNNARMSRKTRLPDELKIYQVCRKVHDSGGDTVKIHCIIHQETLCPMAVQLGDVMNITTLHQPNLGTSSSSQRLCYLKSMLNTET